ncbi:MAG TPA: glycosyltransferase [Polyangia bacterium]|nr:glycosyltransferase [Polyangia bacterium]
MRFVMFCHSLVSDWNHGNAHFLRGIVSELQAAGHLVDVYEPEDGWSRTNLLEERGQSAVAAFEARFPSLRSMTYAPGGPELETALAGADVVIVHEWTDPALVAALGAHRARRGHYRLLYHDTHHRAVSDRASWERLPLGGYDAALVFGRALAEVYRARSAVPRVFTWHEAADVRVFHPLPAPALRACDLVWIGNWGDDERAAELDEFLLGPIRTLGLSAEIYGVRYPERAIAALEAAGAVYRGYLPNHEAPAVFAGARLTVHVPRRYYAEALPGIPTIRPFEALACGVPMISAPWQDAEGLFEAGRDFLYARSGAEMTRSIAGLLSDEPRRRALAQHGRATILRRHTCAHRVAELLQLLRDLGAREAA